MVQETEESSPETEEKTSTPKKGKIARISIFAAILVALGIGLVHDANTPEKKLKTADLGSVKPENKTEEKQTEKNKQSTKTEAEATEDISIQITQGIENAKKAETVLKEFGYSGYGKKNIEKFQKMLNMLGYNVPVNGKMKPDDKTWNAAQDVKSKYLGKSAEELEALIGEDPDFSGEPKGKTVVFTQMWIFKSGYNIVIDGIYGSGTDSIYKDLTGYYVKMKDAPVSKEKKTFYKEVNINEIQKELGITYVYLNEVAKKVKRVTIVHGTLMNISEITKALEIYDGKLIKIEKRMQELVDSIEGNVYIPDPKLIGEVKGMLNKVKAIRKNLKKAGEEVSKIQNKNSVSELMKKSRQDIAKAFPKQPALKKPVVRKHC